MTDNASERRLHKRHKISASIYIGGSQVGELRALDLSHGGVFVATKEPFSVHTNLTLEIELDGAVNRLQMVGEVVHSLPGGMGIRFTELDGTVAAELDGYLKSLDDAD